LFSSSLPRGKRESKEEDPQGEKKRESTQKKSKKKKRGGKEGRDRLPVSHHPERREKWKNSNITRHRGEKLLREKQVGRKERGRKERKQ